MSWLSWCRSDPRVLGLALESLAFSSGGPRLPWHHLSSENIPGEICGFKDVFRPWFRKAPENCFCVWCSVCLYGICRIGCTEMDFPRMWFVPTSTALLLPIPHTESLLSRESLSHFKQRIWEVMKQSYQESDKHVVVTRLCLPWELPKPYKKENIEEYWIQKFRVSEQWTFLFKIASSKQNQMFHNNSQYSKLSNTKEKKR